jgi:hypothetical protein
MPFISELLCCGSNLLWRERCGVRQGGSLVSGRYGIRITVYSNTGLSCLFGFLSHSTDE